MKRKRGRKPQTPKTNGHAPEEQLLQCDDCEFSSPDLKWVVSIEENCKRLYRSDTNEVVDTRPLSAEDRAEEEQRVASINQEQPNQMEAGA